MGMRKTDFREGEGESSHGSEEDDGEVLGFGLWKNKRQNIFSIFFLFFKNI